VTFLPIIATRRDGGVHTEEELRFLANGAADGSIPDYQLAAWLMAAYLNPLTAQETAWLTLAMADSGERLDLSGLPKPWVDKHSTGGVGDKTSIVVLPLLAACGLTVIKMSGRGLGITGGTVDKLSAVPGFRVDLTPEEMKTQARRIGLALTGQTPALAPADKTLYALRDVTATVGSIPLIVSSILSKKLAGGADVIVLDVKCGSGAFMKSLDEAQRLTTALLETAKLCGLQVRVAITDMSEPLGAAVGNALEVAEALSVLDSRRRGDLPGGTLRFQRLCTELAAITLEAAGVSPDRDSALRAVSEALSSGAAMQKASEWFVAQGASDPRSDSFVLPAAQLVREVRSPSAGYVGKIHCDAVGQAVLELGGGRLLKTDEIDPAVGLVLQVEVGSPVRVGEAIFTIHASSAEAADRAEAAVANAFEFSADRAPAVGPVLEVR
jgi:pyrimidine-nucleoside phosphorylase